MADFETVKNASSLKEFADSHLTHRGGNTYNCPICGSGQGPKATAAFTINGEQWKCFSCDECGDVFDLAGIVNKTDSKKEQLSIVANFFGIENEGGTGAKQKPKLKRPPLSIGSEENFKSGRAAEAEKIRRAQENIENPRAVAYLESRGISLELAKYYGFGYDIDSERLVIPIKGSDYYHIDRDITGSKNRNKYHCPDKRKIGDGKPLWNECGVGSEAFFVVEGPLDAIAVESCGYVAVALCGIANGRLLEAVKAAKRPGTAILLLDNDEAGSKGSERLKTSLESLGVACTREVLEGFNDAFEAFTSDREALGKSLGAYRAKALEEAVANESARYAEALSRLHVIEPFRILEELWDVENLSDPVPTGFSGLDNLLNGGLPPKGLCIIGAVSSGGKTTFCLQLADRMAMCGNQVLFVTIEQTAQELVAKSLARIMAEEFGADPLARTRATAQEIMSKKSRSGWQDVANAALLNACNVYAERISPRLKLYECETQPTVSDIRTVAETIAAKEGRPPVVFIDYLQLIAPMDKRDSTKEATDHNITELRLLANRLRTPVVVISSLNRGSYSRGVTMDAFKESGAIEYGADILLGLQPEGMTERLKAVPEKEVARTAETIIRENRRTPVRPSELVVLKQRNGKLPEEPLILNYDAAAGLFTEDLNR